MSAAIFLIGLPASGKSTLRELMRPGYYVASSDDFIEAAAKQDGKTYDEVFRQYIDPATKHFNHMVSHAVSQNKPVIIDRTNLTVASRKKTLDKIPVTWKKIAIVVSVGNHDVWEERLKSRPGKTIPDYVLSGMAESYQEPSLEEGFAQILEYRTA